MQRCARTRSDTTVLTPQPQGCGLLFTDETQKVHRYFGKAVTGNESSKRLRRYYTSSSSSSSSGSDTDSDTESDDRAKRQKPIFYKRPENVMRSAKSKHFFGRFRFDSRVTNKSCVGNFHGLCWTNAISPNRPFASPPAQSPPPPPPPPPPPSLPNLNVLCLKNTDRGYMVVTHAKTYSPTFKSVAALGFCLYHRKPNEYLCERCNAYVCSYCFVLQHWHRDY
jgi:hypothetical protein